MAKSGLFGNHPCPHCGATLTTTVWKERYFCCEQCGVGVYSNGPWIAGACFVVGATLFFCLYAWLRARYDIFFARLIALPATFLIALAFAIPADHLLRVRADAAMSEAIRAAERLRKTAHERE